MPAAVDHFIETPDNRMPEGGVCSLVQTGDNKTIRVGAWMSDGETIGTVCIFPGRSEFIEKYFEVIGELRMRGFAVAAMDWRGQGGSERELNDPRKGHVDDFDQYLLDLDAVFGHLAAINAPRPWFGVGHSMGGAILLLAASKGERRLRRMVLSAPMTGLHSIAVNGAASILVNALNLFGLGGFFIPRGRKNAPSVFAPFEGNVLTSDAVRYHRMASGLIAGPDLAIGAPTIAWISAAFRLIRAMHEPEFGLQSRIPSLSILAGADTVVSTPMAEALAARVRGAQSITIAGARHEILFERDCYRSQFWAAFDAFVPGESARPVSAPATA